MGSNTRTDRPGGLNQVLKRGWERFLPERPLRVLLVEDDDATRQVVCALLSKCGYEVNPVSDGLKAWDLMEHSDIQFDLVLTDAAMPLLSGTDLLTKIMISEAHRDTPVIMMSSHDSLDVVFKCLLRGAKDFLVKPLRKNELRNLWQHVWRKNHASSRVGRGSGTRGERIKVARLSGSGDVSSFSKDDSSQSSDRYARSQSDKGSVTQSLWTEPPTAEEDLPMHLGGDLPMQQRQVKYISQVEQVPMGKNSLLGDLNIDQQCLNYNPPGAQRTMSPQKCAALSEGSEASERSAKAIDLIGTMAAKSRQGKYVWKAEDEDLMLGTSESLVLQDSLPVPQWNQSHPALELTLKGPSPKEDEWFRADARKSVKQSDCSAFSRYTGGALLQRQQCLAAGGSLSSDQCSLAEVFRSPNGDGAVTANTTTSTCINSNGRKAGTGSCGSSTLHFPRAIPFQQGRQDGKPTVSFLASCCDYDGTDQERNLFSLRSPPLNLSTANSSLLSNETLPSATGQPCTNNLQTQIHSDASPTVSVWSPTQSEAFGNEVNHDSGDYFEHESQFHRHHRPLSSMSVPELAVSMQEHETLCQKVLQSAPSGIENLATGRVVSTNGLNVSGSGSNTGSNDGSNLHTCHLRGQAGKSAPTQESCSFGDFVRPDENSMANCSGAAASEAEVHCAMLPPDCSRATLREAALNKFRQKRKIRCFDKKVRYQSRKKLAEQRPRVKGQFVRQAVYDASLVNPCKLEQYVVGS